MKPLLLLQAESLKSDSPDLVRRHGDCDRWFTQALQLRDEDIAIIRVFDNEPLPPIHNYSGVIVSGSSAMVEDSLPWISRLQAWLTCSADEGVPILGVCFGHQLIAQALGGTVQDNLKGEEIGTVEITLSAAAKGNVLFGCGKECVNVQSFHKQSISICPDGSETLASNAHDAHQAIRFKPNIWGVQFHPEMTADIVKELIIAETIQDVKTDPLDQLSQLTVRPSAYGFELLVRFKKICRRAG